MSASDQLGPIISHPLVEQTIRDLLRRPQWLGSYLDESFRQSYGAEMRVLRPRDIVCSTDDTGRLQLPAIVIQVEGTADPTRMPDHTYAASYVVGLHCLCAANREPEARRTSALICAAATALCLQHLPGSAVGEAQVRDVTWQGSISDTQPPDGSPATANSVGQLAVTVAGVVRDTRPLMPDLDGGTPGNPDPAPPPPPEVVIEDVTIELDEEEQP